MYSDGLASGGNGTYGYSAIGLPTTPIINANTGAITGTPTMPIFKPGDHFTLTVTGMNTSGLMFTSSNPNVVTVNPTTGAVTMIATGTATITVTGANGAKGMITITVTMIQTTGLTNPNPVSSDPTQAVDWRPHSIVVSALARIIHRSAALHVSPMRMPDSSRSLAHGMWLFPSWSDFPQLYE